MDLQEYSTDDVSKTDQGSQSAVLTPEDLEVEIAFWCRAYLAEILELNTDEIDTTTSFERYGLDSSATVGLTGDLSEWLAYQVDTEAPYDYPSISKLSRALAGNEKLLAAVARSRGMKVGK